MLPRETRFEADRKRYLLVHGSPRRINEYLYGDKPDATFARVAAGANADIIVCGHTHRPYDKTVGDARFINDGSAGKPKDGDPGPGRLSHDNHQGRLLVQSERATERAGIGANIRE